MIWIVKSLLSEYLENSNEIKVVIKAKKLRAKITRLSWTTNCHFSPVDFQTASSSKTDLSIAYLRGTEQATPVNQNGADQMIPVGISMHLSIQDAATATSRALAFLRENPLGQSITNTFSGPRALFTAIQIFRKIHTTGFPFLKASPFASSCRRILFTTVGMCVYAFR